MAVVQLLFPQHYRSVRAALLGQRPRQAAPLEGATFTDANITGDGEYTVTLDGVNDGGWNMLKLESNIDLDATPDVKFEITSVELNGAAVDFDKDAASG